VHSATTKLPSATWLSQRGEARAPILLPCPTSPDAEAAPSALEVTVTAADGTTDLHGLLYLPPDFSEAGSYPVVHVVYGGPQAVVSEPRWAPPWRPGGSLWVGAAALARAFTQLGMVGLVMDARGTPGRGRAFQSAASRGFGTTAVDDYVGALDQLADRHRWFDKERVGALGISFGGYLAARCGLLAPQAYRAVVAVAGPMEPELAPPFWFEALLGVSFQDDPTAYRDMGLVSHAEQFRSDLLLIHGTADRNVTLDHTLRFSDALTRAGKRHGLILAQGEPHTLPGIAGEHVLREAAVFLQDRLGVRRAPEPRPLVSR
jgi:dipeptidyl aminopeptidase/acylaminoacyl peptidase